MEDLPATQHKVAHIFPNTKFLAASLSQGIDENPTHHYIQYRATNVKQGLPQVYPVT